MQNLIKTALCTSLFTLAACATPPNAAPPKNAAAPAFAAAPADDELRTGSRIPKRGGGDRTVRTIGSQEARDTLDLAPKPYNSQ